MKRIILISILAFISLGVHSQITSYLGASATAGITQIRNTNNTTYGLAYTAGISYALWEFPGWYLKSGLGFTSRYSGLQDIPKYWVNPEDPFTRIDINYNQLDLSLPIQGFFPVFQHKNHTLLLLGGLEMFYTLREQYQNDNYGIATVTGVSIETPIKTGLMFGAGYQYQFNDITYLNIFPSMNFDIRSDRRFTSFLLTAELLIGVY